MWGQIEFVCVRGPRALRRPAGLLSVVCVSVALAVVPRVARAQAAEPAPVGTPANAPVSTPVVAPVVAPARRVPRVIVPPPGDSLQFFVNHEDASLEALESDSDASDAPDNAARPQWNLWRRLCLGPCLTNVSRWTILRVRQSGRSALAPFLLPRGATQLRVSLGDPAAATVGSIGLLLGGAATLVGGIGVLVNLRAPEPVWIGLSIGGLVTLGSGGLALGLSGSSARDERDRSMAPAEVSDRRELVLTEPAEPTRLAAAVTATTNTPISTGATAAASVAPREVVRPPQQASQPHTATGVVSVAPRERAPSGRASSPDVLHIETSNPDIELQREVADAHSDTTPEGTSGSTRYTFFRTVCRGACDEAIARPARVRIGGPGITASRVIEIDEFVRTLQVRTGSVWWIAASATAGATAVGLVAGGTAMISNSGSNPVAGVALVSVGAALVGAAIGFGFASQTTITAVE